MYWYLSTKVRDSHRSVKDSLGLIRNEMLSGHHPLTGQEARHYLYLGMLLVPGLGKC